jgi:hypothetical protein
VRREPLAQEPVGRVRPLLEAGGHGDEAAELADEATGVASTGIKVVVYRDENGTDIFRPYSRPNSFRGVLIHPYPSPHI